MPDAEAGCSNLYSIFANHIYKDSDVGKVWQQVTAISGVHTLGGAHLSSSGFTGSQTNYMSKGVLNNDYFKNLLVQGWGPNLNIGGNSNRNQWKPIDNSTNNNIMMLNSDICLAYDYNSVW